MEIQVPLLMVFILIQMQEHTMIKLVVEDLNGCLDSTTVTLL